MLRCECKTAESDIDLLTCDCRLRRVTVLRDPRDFWRSCPEQTIT